VIELSGVTKVYGRGAGAYTALDDVDLRVEQGQIAAVVGPSGAGKSTLARCLTLLTTPTSGSVSVDGVDLTSLGTAELRRARQSIGTVFQGSNLLERRTAAGNVALPLEYLGVTPAAVRERVGELLELVGLGDRAGHYPSQLSGGQRQRVGIARALALRPRVLVADEATSGLDPQSTEAILALVRQIRSAEDLSVVLITHEMEVVRSIADTVHRLDRGRLVESGPLRALVTDPASTLAAQLLPARAPVAAPPGTRPWTVLLGGDGVPLEWLQLFAGAVGGRVALLSASIEAVGGGAAGRAVVAVDPDVPDELVASVLTGLGLHGTPRARDDDAHLAALEVSR
jgi:D-methionine transport system ATP-binding protein